jgi:glycine C-acetyltransferase
VISDELNHASIIDGIRLCKARRYRYPHDSLEGLEACLEQAARDGARTRLVFSDGVFSMDGTIARLDAIRALCDRHDALLAIDECHATGFLGRTGRGTHELRGVYGRVDVITGTFGKALGGASGGFTAGRREIIELLRQRSRPYLFSNTLAPAIAGASIAVLDLLEASTALRDRLEENTRWFRAAIAGAGFEIKPGEHPIVQVMVYDAARAQALAARLLELGVYVVGFFFPVVPRGQARIRVQMSAVHDRAQLERAVAAFAQAGRELGITGAPR